MNGTYQIIVFADDVNLCGENLNCTMRDTEALLEASKQFNLEIDEEKTGPS